MRAFANTALEDMQGFGIAGFNKDLQELLVVEFNTATGAKGLLGWLAGAVADAFAVTRFNQAFSELLQRTGNDPTLKATWVAVMISAAGFSALGDQMTDLPTGTGPAAFKAGMANRANEIGDAGFPTDQPSQWLPPFRPGANQVHAIILVASDDECDLDRQVLDVLDHIQSAGCTVVFHERGATLPGTLRGHEHFGYKDGISQPNVAGTTPTPPADGQPTVPPGDFVLGYPNAVGGVVGATSRWQHGSFVVFRRLAQDVARFRQIRASGITGTTPKVSGTLLGAKMVGRWPSGAPIEEFPTSDPGPEHAVNNFDYQTQDAAGSKCPVWAHIRKANPRDEHDGAGTTVESRLHRMIRRGIPFGPPLPPTTTAEDGVVRGLHFFAVVCDVTRQFEFVQRTWINNPDFPVGSRTSPTNPYLPTPSSPPGGPDPIEGEHPGTASDSFIQSSGSAVAFPLGTPLVNVTAGEYFFLPSLSMIRQLASPSSG